MAGVFTDEYDEPLLLSSSRRSHENAAAYHNMCASCGARVPFPSIAFTSHVVECRMIRQASSGVVDANPVRGIRDVSCTVLKLQRSRDVHFVSARRSRKFSEVPAMMRCPIASHERNFGFLQSARCRRSGSPTDCSLDQSGRVGDGASGPESGNDATMMNAMCEHDCRRTHRPYQERPV